MQLITTPLDAAPQERLSLYRERRIAHGVLLVPWDALSHIQREAALQLAAEWGRELAGFEPARVELAHTPEEERTSKLAALWLARVLSGPIHAADAQFWSDEAGRWRVGEGTDPRLAAFRDTWNQDAPARGPVPIPGPKCPCPACRERFGKPKPQPRPKPKRR